MTANAGSPRPFGRHLISLVAVLVGAYVAGTAIWPSEANVLAKLPGPDLSPAEVVRIQVSALGQGSDSEAGIAVAFRFASPNNRAWTGPISHFSSMIRSANYSPLLDNVSVQYGRTLTREDRSYTALIVTDRRGVSSAFVWVLSRQASGRCEDCWMTDTVVPIGDMQSLKFA